MQILGLATDACRKIKIIEISNITTIDDEMEDFDNGLIAKSPGVRRF